MTRDLWSAVSAHPWQRQLFGIIDRAEDSVYTLIAVQSAPSMQRYCRFLPDLLCEFALSIGQGLLTQWLMCHLFLEIRLFVFCGSA